MSSSHDAANPTAVETDDNAPERPTTSRRRSKVKKKTRKNAYLGLRKRASKDVWRKYADLLAETASTTGLHTAEKYNATQNGIVIWSPHEKELLFNALDRKGKNGIAEIAMAVGSKSELEVQEHLRLLHMGLERQHLRDRHSRTIILGDVPAATEIRADCDRVLDGYAELLRLEEQYLEDINGRKRHHDAWLIDREKAEEIEEDLEKYNNDDENDGGERSKDPEGRPEGRTADQEDAEQSENTEEDTMANSTIHQTAELLHLEKWIRLSERFFMNPGGRRLEDNWNNIAYADETPSLTADAFVDFYSLALSLTRRIVHSTLFFAMSRLRRMRNSGHRKAKLVKTRDVRAALGVLGMKQKTKPFWIGLARRCSLDVVDARHVKGWKSVSLDHNQVEDYLSGGVKYATNSEAENVRETDNDNDDDNGDDDSVLSDVRSSPERILQEEPLYLSHEDEHAEMLDRKATKVEENHLYQLLEHAIPSDLDPNTNPEESEDSTEPPRRPKGERKSKEDLVDWRDRTLYQSEWEEYGRGIFDIHDDIAQHRRKRRRIAQDEPSRFASPVSEPSVSTSESSDGDIEVDRDGTDTQDVVDSTIKYDSQNEHDENFDDEPLALHDQAVESESDSDQESKPVPSPSQSPRHGPDSDYDQESKPVPSPSQSSRDSGSDDDQESKSVPGSSQSRKDGSESNHETGSEDYEEQKQELPSNIEDGFKRDASSEHSDSETKASPWSRDIPFGQHPTNPGYL